MEQSAAKQSLIGQTIGNYQIRSKLGEGGMGSVYLAEHPLIGKKVAFKVLHPEFSANEDVVKRFFNEAKSVTEIQHPNIVDVLDYGVLPDGGSQMVYFIMEFLNGIALSQLLQREHALPAERALTICLQCADALAACHDKGIIHRDLKPDNIMLIQRGRETDFVKLLDFGIAKLTGTSDTTRKTRAGVIMGTPAYMSPEQCEGLGRIDARTDIYSLGILLYEMITGTVPFQGQAYGDVLVQHLTREPARPSTVAGIVPPHVEAVILKALRKRADDRFPSMAEMAKALADPVSYVEMNGGLKKFQATPLTVTPLPVPSLQAHDPSGAHAIMRNRRSTGAGGPSSNIFTPMPESQERSNRGIIVAALLVAAAVGVIIYFALGLGATPAGAPALSDAAAANSSMAVVSRDAAAISSSANASSAPTGTAKVKIESYPRGAAIYVGGDRVGKTPQEIELPIGEEVTIKLRKSGYDSISKIIKPSQGDQYDWSLRKSSSSRRSTRKSTSSKTSKSTSSFLPFDPTKTGP